jgi:hypothetical protein
MVVPSPSMIPIIRGTMTITYILLVTTAVVIFIEALRHGATSQISHMMNLETAISVVATYFYSLFMEEFSTAESTNRPIDWDKIIRYRYTDWSITTPIMLLVLMLFMANHLNVPVKLGTYLIVVVLNYIMLSFGYLGETGEMDKTTGLFGGFAAFGLMFYIIYTKYMRPKYSLANSVIFWFYAIVWSMYGIIYTLDDGYKVAGLNVLDMISKCLVGLGLWAYYTKILTL